MAEISFRQALNETLREELVRDENVFLMGEEIGVFEGSYKITAGLLKEFGPKRLWILRSLKMVLWGWRLVRLCSVCVLWSRL